MSECLKGIVDFESCPIMDVRYIQQCVADLEKDGVVALKNFFSPTVVQDLVSEAEKQRAKAYFTSSTHNVYLTPNNKSFGEEHVFNRQVSSSKGCITTDQLPPNSKLHVLYRSNKFKSFISMVVGESALFECGDKLSGINVHYAANNQELGWHFDNSSFAITLLLQKPLEGGAFEYVRDLRDADAGEMNFDGVKGVLDGKTKVEEVKIEPGTLVLFRGKNSIHRVTPTAGAVTRILVVLAYNNKPNVILSEAARMTFFGRLS